LAGALSFDEKSAKMQLYFGLDCGMMEFFTYELQPKEQLICLVVWAHAKREPNKQED
jgi:hypothetical protein